MFDDKKGRLLLTEVLGRHSLNLCILELEYVTACMLGMCDLFNRHAHSLVDINFKDAIMLGDNNWVATLDAIRTQCTFQRLKRFRLCGATETGDRLVDVTKCVKEITKTNPII